jgi:hypothetical protein
MLETLGLWIGGVVILLAVLSMAASHGRSRSTLLRGAGAAAIGNALMRGLAEGLAAFQAIEEPQRQYVLEQRKGGNIEQDEGGGADEAGGGRKP